MSKPEPKRSRSRKRRNETVADPGVSNSDTSSRRVFIKGGGLMLAGSAMAGGAVDSGGLSPAASANAVGSDTIKVGLIGCGWRGKTAMVELLNSSDDDSGIQLVAMADVFPHAIQSAYRAINGRHASQVDVGDRRFGGINGFEGVMASDANLVVLATPPAFRPQQFEAAVSAGKHILMERPVAVDAPGVRRVIAAGKIAGEKGLAVQAGFQRRHDARLQSCIERIQQGAIGDLIYARTSSSGRFSSKTLSDLDSTPDTNLNLEHQVRHWRHFDWLGGDLINEQHVASIDVINWLCNGHPLEAVGHSGYQSLDRSTFALSKSLVADHQAIEFRYTNGLRLFANCRRQKSPAEIASEHVQGTLGSCDLNSATIRNSNGDIVWQSKFNQARGQCEQSQRMNLVTALRTGRLPNEIDAAVTSTLTSIMGRIAAKDQRIVRWNEAINSTETYSMPLT